MHNETNLFITASTLLNKTFLRFLSTTTKPEKPFFYDVMTNIEVVIGRYKKNKNDFAHTCVMWDVILRNIFCSLLICLKKYYFCLHISVSALLICWCSIQCSMLLHVKSYCYLLDVFVSIRKKFSVMMHEEKSKWEMRGRKKRSISISLYESIGIRPEGTVRLYNIQCWIWFTIYLLVSFLCTYISSQLFTVCINVIFYYTYCCKDIFNLETNTEKYLLRNIILNLNGTRNYKWNIQKNVFKLTKLTRTCVQDLLYLLF